MNRTFLGFAAAGLVLGASAADAAVYVGLQQDAGPITTVASDPGGFVAWGGSFGQFEAVAVTASGQPVNPFPSILQATALEVNNSGPGNAGTLTIYVTSTDNAPLGSVPLESGFATVSLLNHWTETLETYLDPGNGIYALTNPLGSASFVPDLLSGSIVASASNIVISGTGGGPYSMTAVFRITAPGRGAASSEAGVVDAPEPGSLVLLGAAMAGFAVIARRRRVA